MHIERTLLDFLWRERSLDGSNRPLRLHMSPLDDAASHNLLPQRVHGKESVCGGFEYRILCVALDSGVPLKDFIAVPAALEFVTDRGDLRRVCGIVTEASAGDSDGGLATYQLVLRDAFAVMEKRVNSRVFRNMNERQIVEAILSEWRHDNPVLAHALDIETDALFAMRPYPPREFTMQYNESDAAFIRRMLGRRGIAWYFRAGRSAGAPHQAGDDDIPSHTLVLFNHIDSLQRNAADTVRYHRDDATEERDTITRWRATRTLQSACVSLFSWNYKDPKGTPGMRTDVRGESNQGLGGNALAAMLADHRVATPHLGDDSKDFYQLGLIRMSRHDFETKCFQGEGSVRDFCAGEYFTLTGHPEIDAHLPEERDFVITELRVTAHNNLPKEITAAIDRLFARSHWTLESQSSAGTPPDGTRIHIAFTAVRRGTEIVPAYDPAADVPHPPMQSAVVVGPDSEEIYCDQLGRVKIRFPFTRAADHAHAGGAGALGDSADSAWVRVASNWAGNGPGSQQQCGTLGLPRIDTEVLVAFLDGDPDKPVVVGQLYNQSGKPPAFSEQRGLPDNRYVSGLRSREIRGTRGNQLRLDDTPGQVSAQLASDHGASQLNLGWLTHPRQEDGEGKPRGEGAELRSDKAVAVRGAQGVLISSEKSVRAQGDLLSRDGLIAVSEALQKIAKHVSELAQQQAVEPASNEIDDLIARLKDWHQGSNLARDGGGTAPGGQPVVAIDAQAGLVLASREDALIGAHRQIEMVSAADTQLTSGRNLILRAARGISQIALQLGIKLIAASGNVRVQASGGDIEIIAQKRIKLTAANGIDIESPEIRLVAQGAQADYGRGEIVQQSKGAHTIRSAEFDHLDAGDGSPAELKLPETKGEHDQRMRLVDQLTGEAVAKRRYRMTTEDGKVVEGVSDDDGMTEVIPTELAFARCVFELLD